MPTDTERLDWLESKRDERFDEIFIHMGPTGILHNIGQAQSHYSHPAQYRESNFRNVIDAVMEGEDTSDAD